MTRWAPLTGWTPRPDGFLTHPGWPTELRSPDGRWFIRGDVDEGRIEMTSEGPRTVPGWLLDSRGNWVQETAEDDQAVLIADLREAARRRGYG